MACVHYPGAMLLVCALLVACCLCPFNPFRPVKLKSKAVFQMDTLYSSSLSCLSLRSLTHTLLVASICLIATENSSVFNLCCTELMQHNHIQSIRWPFTHPFACKHIHIQLTIRSYHRHMLSYHYRGIAGRLMLALEWVSWHLYSVLRLALSLVQWLCLVRDLK